MGRAVLLHHVVAEMFKHLCGERHCVGIQRDHNARNCGNRFGFAHLAVHQVLEDYVAHTPLVLDDVDL